MNTADRSLALVDYALRRRFVFFALTPALESEKLAAYILKAGGAPALIDKIRHGIGKINNLIMADKDLGPGFLVGHSFFCPTINETKVDDNWYRTIIETEIAPLLREYWFDKKAAEIDAIISQLCDDTT